MTVHWYDREARSRSMPPRTPSMTSYPTLTRMGEWSPENIGGEWDHGGSGEVGDRSLGHNRAGRAFVVRGAGDAHRR